MRYFAQKCKIKAMDNPLFNKHGHKAIFSHKKFIRSGIIPDVIFSEHQLEELFRMALPIEEQKNTDFSQFTVRDFNWFLDNCFARFQGNIQTWYPERILITLYEYLMWYKANEGRINDNLLTLVVCPSLIESSNICSYFVRSAADLNARIAALYPIRFIEDEYDISGDLIPKAALWMSYSGIEKKDLFKVKKTDIDIPNKKIYWKDNEYHIYPESVPVLTKMKVLTQFQVVTNKYGTTKRCDRVESDYLLSGWTNQQSTTAYISSNIQRHLLHNIAIRPLTISGTYCSGFFNRLYTQSETTPDFDELTELKKIAVKHNKKWESRDWREYRKFVIRYKEWKILFGL